jgi:hypothetical protein
MGTMPPVRPRIERLAGTQKRVKRGSGGESTLGTRELDASHALLGVILNVLPGPVREGFGVEFLWWSDGSVLRVKSCSAMERISGRNGLTLRACKSRAGNSIQQTQPIGIAMMRVLRREVLEVRREFLSLSLG